MDYLNIRSENKAGLYVFHPFFNFAKMNSIESLKTALNEHISSLAFTSLVPKRLYGPIDYILAMPGKRIRPILTMLSYEAISGKPGTDILNLANALEFFHNFTLMHDDIMDQAPVRRGKPTVHETWDENIAILSGDALFAFSMGLVVKDCPERAASLTQEFSRIALEVCEGQMEDMDLAENLDVSIPRYLEMIRKKTAVLLGGCMSMGAIAAGADKNLVDNYRTFGELVGLGFQLQDDLMDAFPPENFGKQVGGDIIENKKTFLLLKAQALANPQQTERLDHLLAQEKDNRAKVENVLSIFRELRIEEITKDFIQQKFEAARKLAEDLSKHSQFAKITMYLEEIVNRKL